MRSLALMVVLCLVPFTDALAQNPEAGQTLAMQVCSRCHAVKPGVGGNRKLKPLPFENVGEPLPFEDIAKTPGITELALYAWMTTSHPSMPNIVLEKEELKNIVAYILSLKNNEL